MVIPCVTSESGMFLNHKRRAKERIPVTLQNKKMYNAHMVSIKNKYLSLPSIPTRNKLKCTRKTSTPNDAKNRKISDSLLEFSDSW